MGKVYVFDHPLIQHKVALMRQTTTTVKDFRELAKEVAMLMGFEATRHLALKQVEIETPMEKTTVNMLDGEDIAVVPILRAGLGFVDGMLKGNGFEVPLTDEEKDILKNYYGKQITLGIRPEDIAADGNLTVKVTNNENLGMNTLVHGYVGSNCHLVAKLRGWAEYSAGDSVGMRFGRKHFFDKDTTNAIRKEGE